MAPEALGEPGAEQAPLTPVKDWDQGAITQPIAPELAIVPLSHGVLKAPSGERVQHRWQLAIENRWCQRQRVRAG